MTARLYDIIEIGHFVMWLWRSLLYTLATFDIYGVVGLPIGFGLILRATLHWFRRREVTGSEAQITVGQTVVSPMIQSTARAKPMQ